MQKTEKVFIAPVDTRAENTLLFFTKPFFQFFCAFLNFASAGVQLSIFFLSENAKKKADYDLFIQTLDTSIYTGEETYIFQKLVESNMFIVNTIFLTLAGFWHSFYAYQKIKHNKFVSPRYRWVEHSMITPVIFLQIGIFTGIRDLLTLIIITTLILVAMLLGYIQDKLSGFTVIHWEVSPHEWSYLPYVTMWTIAFVQFFRIAGNEHYNLETYVILTVYLAFFTQTFFAIIQFYFVVIPFKKGYERIDDVSIMEMDGAAHFASIITKMLQAWIPTIGILTST